MPWVLEAPCPMKQALVRGESQLPSLARRTRQVRGPASAGEISWQAGGFEAGRLSLNHVDSVGKVEQTLCP